MSIIDSVSSRTARLKKIIDSNQEASPALTREALLDTFNVVYNRCTNENLHKNDHNSFEFTKNCKYLQRIFSFKLILIEFNLNFSLIWLQIVMYFRK